MNPMRLALMLSTLLLVSACGSREVLPNYDARNLSGTDLSGNWQLQGDANALERQINRAIRDTDGLSDKVIVPTRRAQQRRRQGDGRSRGGLAHVFFQNGERLKITQTPNGLFISFDRAVVEEYRFGENRRISLGQVEAQRVSGWTEGTYTIETLDRNGMKLTERLTLLANGNALERKITFRARNDDAVTVVQTFRKD